MATARGLVAEVEQKYTTFVDLASRPTLPRVDLSPLAAALDTLERVHSPGAHPSGAHPNGAAAVRWVAERPVDSGPLLRLEFAGAPLTKAARYGHPHERYPGPPGPGAGPTPGWPTTAIPPAALRAAVVGFLRAAYGLDGDGDGAPVSVAPRKQWTWTDIRVFNEAAACGRIQRWLSELPACT
jgi:hypothetical protein